MNRHEFKAIKRKCLCVALLENQLKTFKQCIYFPSGIK